MAIHNKELAQTISDTLSQPNMAVLLRQYESLRNSLGKKIEKLLSSSEPTQALPPVINTTLIKMYSHIVTEINEIIQNPEQLKESEGIIDVALLFLSKYLHKCKESYDEKIISLIDKEIKYITVACQCLSIPEELEAKYNLLATAIYKHVTYGKDVVIVKLDVAKLKAQLLAYLMPQLQEKYAQYNTNLQNTKKDILPKINEITEDWSITKEECLEILATIEKYNAYLATDMMSYATKTLNDIICINQKTDIINNIFFVPSKCMLIMDLFVEDLPNKMIDQQSNYLQYIVKEFWDLYLMQEEKHKAEKETQFAKDKLVALNKTEESSRDCDYPTCVEKAKKEIIAAEAKEQEATEAAHQASERIKAIACDWKKKVEQARSRKDAEKSKLIKEQRAERGVIEATAKLAGDKEASKQKEEAFVLFQTLSSDVLFYLKILFGLVDGGTIKYQQLSTMFGTKQGQIPGKVCEPTSGSHSKLTICHSAREISCTIVKPHKSSRDSGVLPPEAITDIKYALEEAGILPDYLQKWEDSQQLLAFSPSASMNNNCVTQKLKFNV